MLKYNQSNRFSVVCLQYLGSMLIKELRGTESTQDACAKMRVSETWNVGG